MSHTTLILNTSIVNPSQSVTADHFIHIESNIITDIGPMARLRNSDADTVIDGRNRLAHGGLINGHNHSAMTLFRGMADDLELNDWLHNHMFPAEAAHVREDMVFWCSQLAAIEMVLSGTTCVADGYFHADKAAMAFEAVGMRAVVAQGVLDFPAPGVPDPSQNIAVAEKFIDNWQNRCELITPAIFVHSPYTCSPDTLKRAKNIADTKGVRLFVHLAETQHEQSMIIDPAGSSPVKHMEALGLLDNNTICIHMIWLDDEDLDILASSGAHVISCPQSNAKLASGICPTLEMVKRNISFGLGTDGSASNNGLDMFREMDFFAKLQKVIHHDPTIFPAAKVFSTVTENTGTILGMEHHGALRPGMNADLVLLDLEAANLTPLYNADLLVYGATGSNVNDVIVNGKIIVRNRELKTIDASMAKKMVRQLASEVSKGIE